MAWLDRFMMCCKKQVCLLIELLLDIDNIMHVCNVYIQTARQPDRQTDSQPDRQTDRQTDRFTHTHTHPHVSQSFDANNLVLMGPWFSRYLGTVLPDVTFYSTEPWCENSELGVFVGYLRSHLHVVYYYYFIISWREIIYMNWRESVIWNKLQLHMESIEL